MKNTVVQSTVVWSTVVKKICALGVAAFLLSGCSAFNVRVETRTEEPTPTSAPVPEGFRQVEPELECPAQITLAIPESYEELTQPGMAIYRPADSVAGGINSTRVLVTCDKETVLTPAEARDVKVKYLTIKPESETLGSNKYQAADAAAGVYQAKLVEGETFAPLEDMGIYGLVYARSYNGIGYVVHMRALTAWGDTATGEQLETVAENVSVDTIRLKALDWEDM